MQHNAFVLALQLRRKSSHFAAIENLRAQSSTIAAVPESQAGDAVRQWLPDLNHGCRGLKNINFVRVI